MLLQLPVNDELVWDNGTPFPEPCIDRIADTVGKVRFGCVFEVNFILPFMLNSLKLCNYAWFQYEALGWLCGGLGFFATLGLAATWMDKASTIPYVSHTIMIPNLMKLQKVLNVFHIITFLSLIYILFARNYTHIKKIQNFVFANRY